MYRTSAESNVVRNVGQYRKDLLDERSEYFAPITEWAPSLKGGAISPTLGYGGNDGKNGLLWSVDTVR